MPPEQTIDTTKPAPRLTDVVLVTGENFDAHVDKVLGKPESEAVAEPDPVEVAAKELKAVEDEKAEKAKKDVEENEEIDHPEPSKKDKLNERFSDLTKKRKEAEAKAEAKAKEAADERLARENAQRERDELKAKYEPPKSDELGPEPTPDQFTDPTEYGKALKEWTADSVRKEDARRASEEKQKTEREGHAKAFQDRLAAHKKASPEFDAKLGASNITVSDQARDAIVRSEVGPQMLEHLADNPEFAAKLAKLNIGDMYYELGKLEAKLTPPPAKATVTDIKAGKAELSKAPAPITPLGGGGAAVMRLSGSDEVPKNLSYEQWKKLREQGKIQ